MNNPFSRGKSTTGPFLFVLTSKDGIRNPFSSGKTATGPTPWDDLSSKEKIRNPFSSTKAANGPSPFANLKPVFTNGRFTENDSASDLTSVAAWKVAKQPVTATDNGGNKTSEGTAADSDAKATPEEGDFVPKDAEEPLESERGSAEVEVGGMD